jgi:prophage regulatory protein
MGFLRVKHFIQLIPVGESTWWRWVAEGKAPAPIKLGPKTTVWRVEDINKFMKECSNV